MNAKQAQAAIDDICCDLQEGARFTEMGIKRLRELTKILESNETKPEAKQ